MKEITYKRKDRRITCDGLYSSFAVKYLPAVIPLNKGENIMLLSFYSIFDGI